MRLDELTGQREPKPERRLAPDAGLDDPVEAVENPRNILGIDARAIVAD